MQLEEQEIKTEGMQLDDVTIVSGGDSNPKNGLPDQNGTELARCPAEDH